MLSVLRTAFVIFDSDVQKETRRCEFKVHSAARLFEGDAELTTQKQNQQCAESGFRRKTCFRRERVVEWLKAGKRKTPFCLQRVLQLHTT